MTISIHLRRCLEFLLVAILVASIANLLNTTSTMSPVWYGPYLSAAVNSEWGGVPKIDLEEVKSFSDLPPNQREQYRFSGQSDLIIYRYNQIGFVYLVALAKRVFFWLPDVRATEALQITIHSVICAIVIVLLKSPTKKALFLALYAANPLVLYFVTYPFYYFYQVVPSFALLMLLFYKNIGNWTHLNTVAFIFLTAALALILMTRPSTLGAISVFFVLGMYLSRKIWIIASALLVFLAIVGTGYVSTKSGFWHPFYIGVGAYKNPYMEGFSDNNGYALYERKTGEHFSASLGGNRYDDETLKKYQTLLKEEYLSIVKSDWDLLLRNAVLNFGLVYSVGYVVGADQTLLVALSLLGMCFLVMLLVSRQYLIALMVLASNATFLAFVPPIPAYMYGSYILLIIGAIGVLSHLGVIEYADHVLSKIKRRYLRKF